MIGIVNHHLAQVGHVNGLQWVYVLCLIYRFQHLCGVLYSVIRSIFVGFPRFSCIIKEKRLILHRVFQTTVSGFSFPPPLMAATIKGFFTSIKKKNSVITVDCVVTNSFIITLQRYCFFSIYANILATFLCKKSVFTHILIYVNYYIALYCKSRSYTSEEK